MKGDGQKRLYRVLFRPKLGTAEIPSELDHRGLLSLVETTPDPFLAETGRVCPLCLLRLSFTRFRPLLVRFWSNVCHTIFLFAGLPTRTGRQQRTQSTSRPWWNTYVRTDTARWIVNYTSRTYTNPHCQVCVQCVWTRPAATAFSLDGGRRKNRTVNEMQDMDS